MEQDPTDPLAPIGRKLLKLDPDAYRTLVHPGPGNPAAKDILDGTHPRDLIAGPIARPDDADAMLAGLWLYFDWLEPSHRISQDLPGATGAFWHAILHRRDGDFSNSKYWYARCRNHPILPAIGANVSRIVNEMPADKSLLRLITPGWNPDAFVDFVEQIHTQSNDPRYTLGVAIQKIEWQMLFDHCTRSAAGR
jgi:hypothetical protein